MSQVRIRFAKKADAAGILKVHYSAVHEIASRDYPSEVISEWSTPVTAERIERYLRDSFSTETTLVAVIDDNIVGFGSIVESINELRAVYVSSGFSRQGAGTALLRNLERMARERGCSELRLDSSLTAEPFYRHHGYREIERGFHTLRTGRKMACVKMSKSLGAEESSSPNS